MTEFYNKHVLGEQPIKVKEGEHWLYIMEGGSLSPWLHVTGPA